MREVDWVIVDAWTGRYPYYQPISGVMHIWQSLLSDPSWESAYARDGLIVLKRGSGPPKAFFSAFQPSPDIELSPLKVHFGVKGQGMNLVGLAIFPASFDFLLICSDWEILQAGDAQPLLGLKHGEIFQNSEPLASTGFLPNSIMKQALHIYGAALFRLQALGEQKSRSTGKDVLEHGMSNVRRAMPDSIGTSNNY